MIQKKFSKSSLRWLQLAGLAICLFILVLWLIFSPANGALHLFRLNKQLTGITEENKKLEDQNEKLEKDVNALGKDPKYLEETAREQFGLLKKNEIIYQFDAKK